MILIFIEFLSYTIRAFSLAIRLSANITAGHLLLHILTELNLSIAKSFIIFLPLTLVLIFLILLLETGVAFIQTYVFIMLTCIYINEGLKMQH